ncbi:MAG: hypothetical protein IT448_09555 [Phycisphaerales bacterium]|nr:hypothetical protein [Phycisphaerales bacterium]
MRLLPALLVLLMLMPSAALLAQDTQTSALINEQLDKLYEDELNSTLPEAMKQIAEKTGVTIEADPMVWDLLPWGRQTNVTATIKNTTLRQALDAITQKLGLTYQLRHETIELQPMPALKRLAKRATVKELEALDLLRSTKLGQSGQITADQLLAAVDAKLQGIKSDFAIENRVGSALASQNVFVPRNATLADALETLAANTTATWYPWGNSIIVMLRQDQITMQISERTVNLRLKGVPLSQVLIELQTLAGVDFVIEPGALQRVAPEFRIIQLDVQRRSVKEVLETLAGITGLAYTVNDQGVYLWYNATASATSARNPVIGYFTLDNGMNVFIRQDQLGSDLQQYIEFKTGKEIEKLRTMMNEEGFKASTASPDDAAN